MKKTLIGGIILGLSLFFFASSFWIVDGNYDPLGPRFVPQLTIILIGLLALWILIEGLVELHTSPSATKPATAPRRAERLSGQAKSLGVILTLAIYIWALNARIVGFEISTAVFLFVAGMIIHPARGRNLAWLAGLSMVLPPILNFVFSRLFFVNLP